MRIVLFADNYIGLKVIEYLRSNNENIVGIFVHPPNVKITIEIKKHLV